MPLNEAKKYIDQASGIPTMEWISFTGGEPFLLPTVLNELVGYASERNLRTECVTNCSWAETLEKAEETLGALKDSGLDVLNVSADDFHQQFVPLDYVGNCFEAAQRLGLRTVIMSAARREGTLSLSEIVKSLGPEKIMLLENGKPSEIDSAIAVESGFIPAGRGAELPREKWLIGKSAVDGPCRLVLRDIGIDPDGELLACCSASSVLSKGRLGNAIDTGLEELLSDAWDQPLFRILSERGPSSLADSLGIPWKDGFVNRCHLCYEVMKDPRLKEILG